MRSRGIHLGMSLLLARHQERAFERLYRRHVGDVYRYALVVLRDPHAAESVTQATFVTALRAYQRGERPRRPFNWLLGIAHAVCARRSPGDEVSLDAWEEDGAPSPADIRRALGRLGFDERSVLMMREIECRSYAEIAEVLELHDAEVEALIFRARQALREQLEGSLTCHQAERAVSRELDGHLPRSERKLLRAHLRTCPDCVDYERMHRGTRAALRSFETASVPASLRVRRRRPRMAVLARMIAGIATALVIGGALVGEGDPSRWGRDATRIQPADAAPPNAMRRELAPHVARLARKTASKRPPGR